MPLVRWRRSARERVGGVALAREGTRRVETAKDRTPVAAPLLITTATGMLDAVSLPHLETSAGCETETGILIGIRFAEGADLAWPGLVALGAFLLGAIGGGRVVRRRHAPPKLVGEILLGTAGLVALAALVEGVTSDTDARFAVIAILAVAMGPRPRPRVVTRGVADMTIAAATMILHGPAHGSHLESVRLTLKRGFNVSRWTASHVSNWRMSAAA